MKTVAQRGAPRPGRPVRGSKTGRPIMALFDLLGRRWALRVVWELREGPLHFRALREACGGVSPTSLAARIAELREAGVVAGEGEGEAAGYSLTDEGRALLDALGPLAEWAEGWSKRTAKR
ncbi:winged helix-turn-helix transcriptional regulator [Sandaracinus amylolyticus]|uniref:winged helix-turn-helix transcriptional regulator n=1 Tax=Sandaracinus amylolyticus TaxID=927083 RepID=UPI003AF3618B|nr:HTH-type transcriptional regulator YodB [Sandaracinus amylolyticus]